MDKNVEEFFNGSGLQIEKLIKFDPNKSGYDNIEKAMKHVYNKKDSIEPLLIAREVWRYAKALNNNVVNKEDLSNAIKEYKKKINEYKIVINKKNNLLWFPFVLLNIIIVLYILEVCDIFSVVIIR